MKPEQSWAIENVRISRAQNSAYVTVLVTGDTITDITDSPANLDNLESIDGKGALLIPAIVDTRVDWPKTVESREVHAAAKSGISDFFQYCQDYKVTGSGKHSSPTQHTVGSLTNSSGDALAQLGTFATAGGSIVGNQKPITESKLLLQAMSYAAGFNLTVSCTPYEPSLGHGLAHSSAVAEKLGLPAVSEISETLEIARWCLLAQEAGCDLHFSAITSANSLRLIEQFRANSTDIEITCSIPITHLLYTVDDIADYDSLFYLQQPLRNANDREQLLAAIGQEHISVCSNHTPTVASGGLGPFGVRSPGASTSEVLLSQLLQLANKQKINWQDACNAITTIPAQSMKLAKRTLEVGSKASLCLVDDSADWQVNSRSLISASANCIESNQRLPGVVMYTWYEGQLIYGSE